MDKSIIQATLKQAGDDLLDQAKKIAADSEAQELASARPLKEMHLKFSQLIQLPLNSDDRFLLFFMTTYIDDIFANLLLDSPFSTEIEEAREILFKEIGELLHRLAGAYLKNQQGELFEILKELTRVYLEKIDRMNQVAMEVL
ncbi:MAG: hypothetical protein HZC48_13660 [Nitrospirae bacterium]|nr:hypothetical protein [Nitrospirota bacterium]